MLVLTRKVNESVLITDSVTGESIKIMVTTATGAVRLGFEGPQRYRIERIDGGKTKGFEREVIPVQNP